MGNILLWDSMGTQVKTFNKSEKPSRNHHTEASERPDEDGRCGSRPEMRGRTKGHNNAGWKRGPGGANEGDAEENKEGH